MNKGKGFIEEFKKFIMRGNVMDMAVGVIVGGAFTSIVTSLNQDILTPVLGIFGGTDFSKLKGYTGKRRECSCSVLWQFHNGCYQFPDHSVCDFCSGKSH